MLKSCKQQIKYQNIFKDTIHKYIKNRYSNSKFIAIWKVWNINEKNIHSKINCKKIVHKQKKKKYFKEIYKFKWKLSTLKCPLTLSLLTSVLFSTIITLFFFPLTYYFIFSIYNLSFFLVFFFYINFFPNIFSLLWCIKRRRWALISILAISRCGFSSPLVFFGCHQAWVRERKTERKKIDEREISRKEVWLAREWS